MKFKTKNVINVSDWDELVSSTYGRPYCFQQQDGCKSRGTFDIAIPDEVDDFENDSVLETVNGDEMGVSFHSWLERDPKKELDGQQYDWELDLWWSRNFYPSIQMVANDLYRRGLIPVGEYLIDIDW